ncbi:hypothetical protein KUL42_38880 [Alteromonas sp. KUL42]|uniref:DUF2895 family protein n=1 Tax=Alteromonas sp. KUL42 TaxID=2480797 RepID=UPI0010FFAD63|nr:DUF2895 family protein [Alteromonas sp. KUL42]GEA09127.1 hypothetical protein KUL42_38880 [Alteromonas sp. KUL42]
MKTSSERIIDEKNKVIRWLTIVIAMLCILVVQAHMQVSNAPRDWTFWTPPNIDVGGSSKVGVVPEVEAFNFAFLIFGNLNNWRVNGAAEYKKKLSQFKHYLSEQYRIDKLNELQNNEGSYRNRIRSVEFVVNETGNPKFSVKRIGKNNFEVEAVLRIRDVISGTTIFDEERRYFFSVNASLVPRNINPYQMKIMGEYQRYILEKKHV